MEVILLEKIRNLGELGSQVKVKAGYARNYLLPYGKAVPATTANKAEFEARRVELEKSQTEVLAEARDRAEKIQGIKLDLVRKVAAEGKLFGSVGTRDIVDAIAEQGVTLAKSEIQLPQGALKEVGDHEVAISLHPEVNFNISVTITGEE